MLVMSYMSLVSRSRLGAARYPSIPAKSSGLKLISWVFDGRKEKDYRLAPIKVAGIVTCSSWISRGIESEDAAATSVVTHLPTSLVRNLPGICGM